MLPPASRALIALAFLLLSSCTSPRAGDLIFVSDSSDDFDSAVAQSTSGYDSAVAQSTSGACSLGSAYDGSAARSYSHVGIYDGRGGVWEATPSKGVVLTPLEDFLTSWTRADLFRLIDKEEVDTEDVISRASSLFGRPYDFAFAPGDSALYCSELVQVCFLLDSTYNNNGSCDGNAPSLEHLDPKKGVSLFESAPMNFAGPDGIILPYWTAWFDSLGIPVPQGVPGTNPNALSRSPFLRKLRSLK